MTIAPDKVASVCKFSALAIKIQKLVNNLFEENPSTSAILDFTWLCVVTSACLVFVTTVMQNGVHVVFMQLHSFTFLKCFDICITGHKKLTTCLFYVCGQPKYSLFTKLSEFVSTNSKYLQPLWLILENCVTVRFLKKQVLQFDQIHSTDLSLCLVFNSSCLVNNSIGQ